MYSKCILICCDYHYRSTTSNCRKGRVDGKWPNHRHREKTGKKELSAENNVKTRIRPISNCERRVLKLSYFPCNIRHGLGQW